MALCWNHEFTFLEVLWTFSLYLEAVAIIPQLFMLQDMGSAENITYTYLLFLGLYRLFYIINWIYRYYIEGTCWKKCNIFQTFYLYFHLGFYDLMAIVSGIIQTLIYCHFFYLFAKKASRGELNDDMVELIE